MQETVEDGPFFWFQGVDFEVSFEKNANRSYFCKMEVKSVIYH